MDSKVHGTIIRNRDGREIPEDEFIVFRPSDNAVPEMLGYYRDLIIAQGASTDQVRAVLDLEARVRAWRSEHPERCKVADVEPGELVV
jgi:hypothetical protein